VLLRAAPALQLHGRGGRRLKVRFRTAAHASHWPLSGSAPQKPAEAHHVSPALPGRALLCSGSAVLSATRLPCSRRCRSAHATKSQWRDPPRSERRATLRPTRRRRAPGNADSSGFQPTRAPSAPQQRLGSCESVSSPRTDAVAPPSHQRQPSRPGGVALSHQDWIT
jgi:hypothetical protein